MADTAPTSHVRIADPFANLGDHLHDVAHSAENAAVRAAKDDEWTRHDSARSLERVAGVLRTVGVLMHANEAAARR